MSSPLDMLNLVKALLSDLGVWGLIGSWLTAMMVVSGVVFVVKALR